MNILVTGATGFVGTAILQRLASEPHKVHALTRKPPHQHSSDQTYSTVTWHQGDILDAKTLVEAMQGVDAIIHLVGIISEARQVTFENLHTRATRCVLDAMRRAGVAKIVHMSALGTRPHATSRYHQTKWQAEESVRASGVRYTIFRPSLIYGPEDHFVNLFARVSKFSPVLPIMGRGIARFAPVHVATVADAFVRALGLPEANGMTYDLCGPELLTLPDIVRSVLRATARRRVLIRIPMKLARTQAAALEFGLGKVLGVPPPLNRDQLVMLEEGNVGNGLPADIAFQLKHPPFREAIAQYVGKR